MPRGRKRRTGGAAAASGGRAARGGAQCRRRASPARRADDAAEHAEGEQISLDQSTLDALAGLIDAADPDALHLEELECAVCTRPSFKCPVETPCGHTFHRICIDRCVDRCGSLCPTCRSDLPGNFHRDVSRADHRMLNRTKVVCPQGCGAQVTFERLEPHVYGECDRTPVTCGASCGMVILRRDAAAHRRDACPLAVLPPCDACGRETRRRDVQDHVEQVSCPNCHERGIRKCLMDEHLRNACPGALQGGRRGRRAKQPQVQEKHQEQHQPAVRAPPPQHEQNRQQGGRDYPTVTFKDAVSGYQLSFFMLPNHPGALIYTVSGKLRPPVTEIIFDPDGLGGHMSLRFPGITNGVLIRRSAVAAVSMLHVLAEAAGVKHNFPPPSNTIIDLPADPPPFAAQG
eukprot:TRINITY_DN16895_c0_g1_i1.p1 TRINITY_DN16895_c0_g1~~TRINITY_DN16895_c0_g1_i1.p1  ORF type:complete len:424 (+),score=78.15 TRINITY_DN16895_c0_g1_i1:67-1272(+)